MQKVLEVVKAVLASFKVTILATAKAWIAGGVAILVTWLASQGIVIPKDTEDALVVALVGIVTAFFVWLIPNSQK